MNKYSQNFYDSVSSRAIESARIVGEVIQGSIEPKIVVDIGSGQGVWLSTLTRTFPSVRRAIALDLQPHESPFFEEIKESAIDFEFIETNFELSSKLPDERIDLAICLEVLEHLTPNTAVEVAKEMGNRCSYVIFSAAILGQGGTGHINEREFSYWMNLMLDQGFVALDVLRPALGASKEVPSYYKQNLMLFWHPENSKIGNDKLNLEILLANHPMKIVDIRSNYMKFRYAIVALIPASVVTSIVKLLDKTIRKLRN